VSTTDASLDDLRAAAARLVASADADRRRIERELHDGVQQHLVALAVKTQLARALADADPVAMRAMLDEIAADVRTALEELREVAHGVYPSLLLDRGLVEALESLPANVEVGTLGRYPPEIEAAVYFACLAALGGTATRSRVRAWQGPAGLVFEVTGDGLGDGLEGLRDRLAALGGRLEVSGRTVVGTIPLPP
jgi:signal transduction histidine kinase